MRLLTAILRRGKADPPKPARKKKPPRRALPTRVRRALIWAPACAAGLAIVATPVWLWRTGALERGAASAGTYALEMSARAGLAVDQIVLNGRVHSSPEEILAAVAVRRGAAMLGIDPDAVRARLTALPWVRAARVERLLPDRIVVHLVERRPMALWQTGGELALIDDTGVVITRRGLERFRDLVIVVGEDAPGHAAHLLEMLSAEPTLLARVTSATRVGARRWNVRLRNGIDVRLPEDGAAAAWLRLGALEREHELLSREIESVDLRIPDRLILRTKAGRAPLPPPKGRRT